MSDNMLDELKKLVDQWDKEALDARLEGDLGAASVITVCAEELDKILREQP